MPLTPGVTCMVSTAPRGLYSRAAPAASHSLAAAVVALTLMRSARIFTLASLTATLAYASIACSQSRAPVVETPGADDFAQVRATSQAYFQSGSAALAAGDAALALVLLDRADTFDPDNRAEIKQAVAQAAATVRAFTPVPTRTLIPTPTREPNATPQAVFGSATAGPSPTPTELPGTTVWTDPVGRFRASYPPGWTVQNDPPVIFGRGVVSFKDPSGLAEFAVGLDENAQAVSPELYAAKMDLFMQEQLKEAYASESILPGNVGSSPSLRRNFTVIQRTPNGAPINTRAFQVAVVRGSSAYVLYGSAPAASWPMFGAQLEQIAGSFRFL